MNKTDDNTVTIDLSNIDYSDTFGAVGAAGYTVPGGGITTMASNYPSIGSFYTTNTTSPSYVTVTGGGGGGNGGSGNYFSTMTNNSSHTTIKITGSNPKLETEKNSIDLDDLADTMKILKERLLVIVPNFEQHEKYSALKKAYENYKLIENLILNEK